MTAHANRRAVAADAAARAAGRAAAAVMLAALTPVWVAATVALLVERSGPVLRRSPRLGRGGVPFDLLQFRTMRDDPHAEPSARLTTVGRFLRDRSVDHVPMLVNVVRGDLALIGPRPTEPDRADLTDPRWQAVLSVRPGLVSHAVLSLRTRFNRASPDERLALELEYVRGAGPAVDLRVMGRAAAAFVSSRGNVKAR